jgi:hypothetical protein
MEHVEYETCDIGELKGGLQISFSERWANPTGFFTIFGFSSHNPFPIILHQGKGYNGTKKAGGDHQIDTCS